MSSSTSPSPPPPPPPKPSPTPTSSSPPKKSPALPWTHEETVALIESYQEKWYSLKRGQLKAFQWDQVSLNVAARCGLHQTPSKTATQCRHKIEKLRKRYRSELTKPGTSTWQYFDLMDRMERGPTAPLDARPIAALRSSNTKPSFSNNNVGHGGYGDYYYYDDNGGGGGGDDGSDDESDEEWDARCDSKSRSINNIVRGEMRRRSAKRAAVERGGFGGGVDGGRRVVRVTRIPVNLKQKQYYGNDDEDDEDDDEDDSDDEDVDVAVEGRGGVEEGGEEGGGAGVEIAAQIKGFADGFMRMENKKIEMMRDTERYRMEMEKKRMEMILDAQRKIVDTIGRAFGAAH